MSDTQQLPILGAAAYSWKFAQVSLLPTLPAYLVLALVSGAIHAATISGMAGGVLPLDFIGLLLGFLITVSCLAMTIRLAMNGEMDGFTGLRFGADEVRLLFANLMFIAVASFLAFAAIILSSVVLGILLSIVAPDLEAIAQNQRAVEQYLTEFLATPTGWVFSAMMFLMVGFPLLYISARLVNFPVATLVHKKVMIFETWAWTRDQVWRVIGAILLASVPAALITFLGAWLAETLTGISVFAGASALADASPLSGFIFGLIRSLFSIPMSLIGAALAVYMYRGFEPDRQVF